MEELTPEQIRNPKPWEPFSPEWTRWRLCLIDHRLSLHLPRSHHRSIVPFLTSPDPFTRLVTVKMLPELGLEPKELYWSLLYVRLWDPHYTVRAAAGYYLTPVREALMWEYFESQFDDDDA